MLNWDDQHGSSFEELRARYRHFAEREAQGISPLYADLARAVSGSDPILRFVAALPASKQQPNLVFAAVRHLFGTPRDASHFAELVAQHPAPIRALILARSTQTNEPARCATLLPVLARLPGPLALLEVGASAGLCLLPDRWGYDYGRARVPPRVQGRHPAPVFACRASAATPLPAACPSIAWRAGLDLNPLDLRDPAEVAWLETLVWPGQPDRAERLHAAIRVAQDDPPTVARGDLLTDLRQLAGAAPPGATLVVFHSAVLAYVAAADRARFGAEVASLGAVWVSNEAPSVLPAVAARLGAAPPDGQFLLAVNGEPVAFTHPHGRAIEWLEGRAGA